MSQRKQEEKGRIGCRMAESHVLGVNLPGLEYRMGTRSLGKPLESDLCCYW
jgi:hypothetical protein